jgi:DeoR/GlpR family transcriptional regulator of sugar metabolism
LSTASQQTLNQFSSVFADRLFLATYGVHFEKGLAERTFEIAETKRALIASAREITLACDSSKFGSAGPVLISSLTAGKHVITDDPMPAQARDWLKSNGSSAEVV